MSVELQAMSRNKNRKTKGTFVQKLHSDPLEPLVTESRKYEVEGLLTFTGFKRRRAPFTIGKV